MSTILGQDPSKELDSGDRGASPSPSPFFLTWTSVLSPGGWRQSRQRSSEYLVGGWGILDSGSYLILRIYVFEFLIKSVMERIH